MAKLSFTVPEIENIKSQIYLTKEEEIVLEMWLKECSIVEMSFKLHLSTATISRRKKSIMKKILRVI